ncbi:MAG: tyrosine-type recombinase/integrase [Bacteroidota bacterium]
MSLDDYLRTNYSPTSWSSYRHAIGQWLSWVGGEDEALKASYAQVVAYILDLRRLGSSSSTRVSTLRNKLAAIKIYYRYLQVSGQRSDHPCERLRLRDVYDRSIELDRLYTKEQLQELVENYSCRDRRLLGRNRVILSLLLRQALTVREIVAILVVDLKLEKAEVYIRESVSNRARTLPLTAEQILPINSYLLTDRAKLLGDKIDPGTLLLNKYGKPMGAHGISRLINGERSKADRLLPGKIRQSVIHHLLKAGHDVRLVQVFAGHRRISSTQAYQSSDYKELKRGIEEHHPLG